VFSLGVKRQCRQKTGLAAEEARGHLRVGVAAAYAGMGSTDAALLDCGRGPAMEIAPDVLEARLVATTGAIHMASGDAGPTACKEAGVLGL